VGDDTVSVANDNIRVAPAGTASFNVTVSDQFDATISNARVIMTWTGRNASTVNTQKTAYTNADGVASLSYTDTAASTVTATADTVTFTASDGTNSSTSTATVTWVATTVGTVTILGGNNGSTTGVASQSPNYKDIDAGDGAEVTTATATATVKDANGALVVGVPVTFTISGTGAAITSTTQTVYTGSAGTAVANVYGWIAGTYTVTATAGGKSGTADFSFRQSGAGEERAISVTTSGNVVTAKVVDRFGNPVPSVTVYATQAGGVTINNAARASDTTDNSGLANFIVTGSGTVTVSTISWSALPGAYGSGQTSAPKGYLYNSASATTLATYAFTAYTAGTTTADEEGVGASYDAAGVSSAAVDVATT